MTVLGSNQNQPSQASRSDCLHATHLLVYRLRSNDDDHRERFDSPSASRVIPLHYSTALWQRQRQRRL